MLHSAKSQSSRALLIALSGESGSSELEHWLCHAELMEGPVGYDMSHAVWHNAGWQEMRDLRKKLENLKELRDLVKKLGRASGKGPKRRAPQEVRLVCVPVRCFWQASSMMSRRQGRAQP